MKNLSVEDVLDIYARSHEGESQTQIARDYMVAQSTVSGIKRGYYWNQVTGAPRTRPLTENHQLYLRIYSAYWDEKQRPKDIAARFGVSVDAVYCIRNGKTGAHITGHPTRKA